MQYGGEVGLRQQRRDLLARGRVRDLGEPHPAGLLARLPRGGPPLGEGLQSPLALPLGDAAGGGPGHDRVDADLGHGLHGHFAPVALGQRLDDGDTGLRRGLLKDGPHVHDDQPVLALGGLHRALQPPAPPVGEDHVLAGPQPLHRDGVPPFGAVEHDLRSPAVEPLHHEHRRGHRPSLPVRPPCPPTCAEACSACAAAISAASTSTSSPAEQVPGHPVPLPGPQRHALRVPGLGGGLAQRRGEVVDLGVGDGRVRAVLAHEPVDQTARRAPGEGAGQLRADEEGIGQRLLVHGVRAGLGGGEERRAELGRGRARREEGGDLAAAHDAAGRDHRQRHGLADLGDQGEQADACAVPLGVVPVCALVTARLDALHDHGVGPGPFHGLCLLRRGRGDQGERALAGEGLDDLGGRAAEVERHHRHGVVQQHRELGLVAVVAPAVGVAQLGVVPGGLTGQLLRVHLDGGKLGILRLRHEEVHAEGARGERPERLDLLVHPVGRLVPGGEEPQPARLGHGGGQPRHGHTARHRGLHDRQRDEIGQCGGHDGMLPCPPDFAESGKGAGPGPVRDAGL